MAKDLKIQVEFNPSLVNAYRLIGYENRLLAKEDFNNDTKDAGEVGVGHSVTALYEIVPFGVKRDYPGSVDDLKFQKNKKQEFNNNSDLAFFKVRYKKPEGNISTKIEKLISPEVLKNEKDLKTTQLALAVAEFGLLLRNSEFKQNASYENVLNLAEKANEDININEDIEGIRTDFIKLVSTAKVLTNELTSK